MNTMSIGQYVPNPPPSCIKERMSYIVADGFSSTSGATDRRRAYNDSHEPFLLLTNMPNPHRIETTLIQEIHCAEL